MRFGHIGIGILVAAALVSASPRAASAGEPSKAPAPTGEASDAETQRAMDALLKALAHYVQNEAGKPKSASKATGDCATPNKSVDTLLRYLQEDDQYNPGRAAACFSREGIETKDLKKLPLLAERFKKVLDARGLWVVMKEIPTDPAYQNDSGNHAYTLFPDALPDMTWQRDEKTGRWLLTQGARERIPTLYRQTFPFNMDDFVQGLPDFMRNRIIGAQIWQLVGLLILIFLAIFAHWLTIRLFHRYVERVVKRVDVKWIRAAILCGDRPIATLLMAGLVTLLFPALHFSVGFNQIVMLAARVVAAFSLVWLGYRLIDVFTDVLQEKAEATETKLDDQLIPLIRKTIKLFLFIVGAIFILQNLSIDVGSLLAGVGLGGLAFALAAKDTVANFFGSLMIFVDKPFQIGDWITVGSSVEGTVEEVGFRTTRVRTFYNSLITLPNSIVTNSAVDNLGMRRYRRYKTTIGLTYDTPPEKMQAMCEGIRAIVQSLPGMRQDFYLVEFNGFGDSSLDILLYTFMDVKDWAEELRVRTNLNLSILRLARELGVSFAFPSQSLYVEQMPGDKAPSTVPGDPRSLAPIVSSFGPGGARALPEGVRISTGFEPGTAPPRGSHDPSTPTDDTDGAES